MIRLVKHKYKAIPVEIEGIRFASKKEGRYFQQLRIREKSGEIVFFLRQVPIHLPGNVRYVIDFLEFHADGTVHFVDVKGIRTEAYKIKKRMVEAVYPITIEEK